MKISDICIDESQNLTEEEISARDELLLSFNPLLKVAFATSNLKEFKSYGYNSCRQSAVLGAKFLQDKLPDYTLQIYEGKFNDFIGQKPVDYIHYYIIMSKDDRRILIDMSRTTRKLLFHLIDGDNVYPDDYGYEQMTIEWSREKDWREMLDSKGPEYFTKVAPANLYRHVLDSSDKLMETIDSRKESFAYDVYGMFTGIMAGAEWI